MKESHVSRRTHDESSGARAGRRDCSLVDDGALQHLVHHVLFINIIILRAEHRRLAPAPVTATKALVQKEKRDGPVAGCGGHCPGTDLRSFSAPATKLWANCWTCLCLCRLILKMAILTAPLDRAQEDHRAPCSARGLAQTKCSNGRTLE